MVLYTCPRCHYETELKADMRKHYKRKKACKRLFSRVSLKDLLSELDGPKEGHVKISKEEWENILEENRRLKKGCITNNITNNNNNDNSITNNITNNIQININDFKDTDYTIALEDLKESIKQSLLKNDGKNMNIECENLIELVHCNDKYPENQNILLTDMTRGDAKIKQGDRFIKVPKSDAIDQTAQNIVNLLKDNKLFTRYVRFHENKDEDTVREDNKAIERTLYNNSEKVKETAKKSGIKVR